MIIYQKCCSFRSFYFSTKIWSGTTVFNINWID